MKVLHITPAFYPATYWGGPIYSVYGLCNALANIPAINIKVLTTDSAGHSRKDTVNVFGFPMIYPGGYEVYFCKRLWASSFSPSMLLRLWTMIRRADVIHLTAVYSPPTIPTLLISRLLNKSIVWSPRGAFQSWEGTTRSLFKRLWKRVCNWLIKPGRCVLHVTSDNEADVSVESIPKAVTELISNGVKIPHTLPDRSWRPDGKMRLLYIGRLHPIKGIENLLHALKIIDDKSVSLTICGTGDRAYTNSLCQLVHELDIKNNVHFKGHVDDEEKFKSFVQSDLCVVPSFTENFGMVVAEALAHGVPVITSKGTPWAQIEKHDCGLWVENSPSCLAKAIITISNRRLEDMGKKGREWAQKELGWEGVANKMFNLYQKCHRL